MIDRHEITDDLYFDLIWYVSEEGRIIRVNLEVANTGCNIPRWTDIEEKDIQPIRALLNKYESLLQEKKAQDESPIGES